MKVTIAAAAVLLMVVGSALAVSTHRNVPLVRVDHGTRTPVLVELFTSEGCSDCPAADRVLSDLTHNQSVDGAYVVALGEHVDYWNHQGWRDRFSSAAFSRRQWDYAGLFHLDEVYTPQMVVDGQHEFVGTDSDKAVDIIGAASGQAHATVSVIIASTPDPSRVIIKGNVNRARGESGKILVAITEDGLTSRVAGGENRGRTLIHEPIVRYLSTVGETTTQSTDYSTGVTIATSWVRSRLKAVAFVQDTHSGAVLGTGMADF